MVPRVPSAALIALLSLSAAGGGPTARADAPAAPEPSIEAKASAGTRVRADARPRTIRAGDTFVIEVSLRAARNVGAAAFHLVFDPALVEPVAGGFREGDVLGRDGAATSFLSKAASTGDRIVVGAARLGAARGARGRGTLCRLTFRALRPGATSIVFDRARLTAPDASEISARFMPARLTIAPPRAGQEARPR